MSILVVDGNDLETRFSYNYKNRYFNRYFSQLFVFFENTEASAKTFFNFIIKYILIKTRFHLDYQ